MLLLKKRGGNVLIIEEVVKAAAGNKLRGKEVIMLLLKKRGGNVLIIEEVVKAVAGNRQSRKEVIMLLLKERGGNVLITEEVVKAAAGNKQSRKEVIIVLLKERGGNVLIIEEVVKAAAGNRQGREEVIMLLLKKRGGNVLITEEVVKAAAGNRRSRKEVIIVLLKERGGNVLITEEVVKAAAGNRQGREEVMMLLLKKRGGNVLITEEVVKAAAGNRRSGKEVMMLLLKERRGDFRTTDKYVWIADLENIGYTYGEIAELLYERAHDSPWIYFEPANIPLVKVQQNHHLDGCAHRLLSHYSHGYGLTSWPVSQDDQDRDVRRSIEELCGLGGVSPSSRDTSRWNGMVQFKEQNSVALLSHLSAVSSLNDVGDVISRLIRVAERFSTAARAVQDAGFCCDSFTILRHHSTNENGVSSEVQLVRLDFSSAVQILKHLRTLGEFHKHGFDLRPELRKLRDASQKTLSQTIPTIQGISESSTDLLQHSLHISSLAIQFLCVGFLSYSQAHIGNIQPFFLDAPLQRIALLGMEKSAEVNVYLTASLVKLTCLDGMVQGPVLAFNAWRPFNNPPGIQRTGPFDVRASPEDILDTWGPGQLVFRPEHGKLPLAIKIGGGYIYHPRSHPSDGKYHWDHISTLPTASPFLELGKEIVIGSLVEVNTSCSNDEKRCWEDSQTMFEELGAYGSYSEVVENQLGFQGGPDHFAVTANRVWAKQPGKTVKVTNLERHNNLLIRFLDSYWGVRVSFCTGVAQRVSLRVLVADLLPAFVRNFTRREEKKWWEDLNTVYRVIETFRGDPDLHSLIDWMGSLSTELHQFVYQLVRQILETLKVTGLSPDGTYFSVAWPWNGRVNQCFRIPLDKYNNWMSMLADSDDCATFAYMSNACLQTRLIKCRGPNPIWPNKIHLLETAVLCPASTGSWDLCHGQTYFFHKLDNNLFWVKAQLGTGNGRMPATLVRLIMAKSFPRDVLYRLLLKEESKKKRRLREKNLESHTAKIVFILPTSNP
jgi:hypothetical protein